MLSASVAYAKLTGSYTRSAASTENTTDAESDGFSYSLIWTASWTKHLDYRIGLKLNRYNYELTGIPVVSQHDYNSIIFGLVNYF